MANWTKIPKADGSGGTVTITPGMPIGFLLALTYSDTNTFGTGRWSKVSKANNTTWSKITEASGTSWTKITKPS